MNRTKIEWVAGPNGEPKGFTWNPVVGCSKGCRYCYARRIAKQNFLRGNPCELCRDFVPHLHGDRLTQPLQQKTPSRIFVCSMGELFDPLTDNCEPGYACQGPVWRRVLDAMHTAPQHTYIVLTKQPHRMAVRLTQYVPQPNWHFLTSVANQSDADERVPQLLELRKEGWPVLGVSVEPLLAPVDLGLWLASRPVWGPENDEGLRPLQIRQPGLDWVIIGAQTGPGAVKPDPAWVERIIADCRRAGTPVFVKDNVNWPEQIREYPPR